MAYNYRVVYEETIETLEAVCELYDSDSSDLTMKFISVGAGILVLVFIFIYGEPGGGTLPGLLFFLVKYLAGWAVLAAAAMFINRTVWRQSGYRRRGCPGDVSAQESKEWGCGHCPD